MAVFSVIIPAHNAENFIKEALDSVLLQTYTDYEVIVIDDQSVDSTFNVVQSYDSKFKAAQLLILKSPLVHLPGPAAVRNVGLKAARGDFVAFLDADDIWVPDHLEMAYQAFTKYPELIFYYGLALKFNAMTRENAGILGLGPEGGSNRPFNAFPLFIQDDPAPLPTVCVRRDIVTAIGGFEERLLTAQDWWLWISLSKKGPFLFSDRIEMYCRMHVHSHTSGGNNMKPMLSYPCLADIASKSSILTPEESGYLCGHLLAMTSKRLQHYLRTVRTDVILTVFKIISKCPWGEKIMWLKVWSHSMDRLARRALRSLAVRLHLMSADKQFS